MELADAVHVVAVTPENKVVLVRQFRAGAGRDSLEPPGGLLEPGEDACAAGARELLEETGYAGDPPRLLGAAWSNPSILTSRIYTVLVTNVRLVGERTLDHHEEVEVELVPAGRLPTLIHDGQIDHALAVLALLEWLCSQLPDTPLSLAQYARPPFRINSLMTAIVFAAVLFGLLRGFGTSPERSLGVAIVVPLGAYIGFQLLDPPSPAILLRGANRTFGRLVMRLLASFGVVLLIALALTAGFLILTRLP
jgi:8-oxo-dGTP pyrophosphatase MutT (NUDIX family)